MNVFFNQYWFCFHVLQQLLLPSTHIWCPYTLHPSVHLTASLPFTLILTENVQLIFRRLSFLCRFIAFYIHWLSILPLPRFPLLSCTCYPFHPFFLHVSVTFSNTTSAHLPYPSLLIHLSFSTLILSMLPLLILPSYSSGRLHQWMERPAHQPLRSLHRRHAWWLPRHLLPLQAAALPSRPHPPIHDLSKGR